MRKRAPRSAKAFAVLINSRFHAVYTNRCVAITVRDKFNAMFARHHSRDVAQVVTATVTYDPANLINEDDTETVTVVLR